MGKSPNWREKGFHLLATTFGVILGGFHGGFLIWDGLEKVCGRKMDENAKIQHFLGKIAYWYRTSATVGQRGTSNL